MATRKHDHERFISKHYASHSVARNAATERLERELRYYFRDLDLRVIEFARVRPRPLLDRMLARVVPVQQALDQLPEKSRAVLAAAYGRHENMSLDALRLLGITGAVAEAVLSKRDAARYLDKCEALIAAATAAEARTAASAFVAERSALEQKVADALDEFARVHGARRPAASRRTSTPRRVA